MPSDKQYSWSDEAEAVYFATLSSLEELPDYPARANVLFNLLRHVIMAEALSELLERGVAPTDNAVFVAMKLLGDKFADVVRQMPEVTRQTIRHEIGCGHCKECRAAKSYLKNSDFKVIYAADTSQMKEESRTAVEQLIRTMMGGSN